MLYVCLTLPKDHSCVFLHQPVGYIESEIDIAPVPSLGDQEEVDVKIEFVSAVVNGLAAKIRLSVKLIL